MQIYSDLESYQDWCFPFVKYTCACVVFVACDNDRYSSSGLLYTCVVSLHSNMQLCGHKLVLLWHFIQL